ncbi:transcriptional regulator [Candidatus Bathyarchaeota archaeon]|nr:transcriptional regulator [Candidatus Bathyarchaeota archaeon]
MKPPCVTVVKYLLPAIRVLVTKELIEKYNLRKIDASEKMELTPAAITQYFKGERGSTLAYEITRSKNAMKMISELAETIAKEEANPENLIEKLCEICTIIRNEKTICKLHIKDLPKLNEQCKCPTCIPTE